MPELANPVSGASNQETKDLPGEALEKAANGYVALSPRREVLHQ